MIRRSAPRRSTARRRSPRHESAETPPGAAGGSGSTAPSGRPALSSWPAPRSPSSSAGPCRRWRTTSPQTRACRPRSRRASAPAERLAAWPAAPRPRRWRSASDRRPGPRTADPGAPSHARRTAGQEASGSAPRDPKTRRPGPSARRWDRSPGRSWPPRCPGRRNRSTRSSAGRFRPHGHSVQSTGWLPKRPGPTSSGIRGARGYRGSGRRRVRTWSLVSGRL